MFKAIGRLFRPQSRKRPLSFRTFVPSSHVLRPILAARYLEMRAGMASGDSAAIEALLTPDLVSKDVFGKSMSAKQMIAAVKSLDIDRSRRTAVTTLLDIDERGDLAYVRQLYVMTYASDRRSKIPKGLWTLSTDVWHRSDNWRIRSTETLELEALSQ